MANNKSAEKRWRQSLSRRARNRARLSHLRSSIKRVRSAVAEGDAATAKELLPHTLRLIDQTSKAGTIHANAASRRKSRLTKLVATLDA